MKKLKLNDLSVQSFVTKHDKVKGGTGVTNTEQVICESFADTFCKRMW